MKTYRLGMFIGRFQPFHRGHKAIIDCMLAQCEQVLIVVGSSQEKGTAKNPFPAWERMDMIYETYRRRGIHINVLAMPDRLTVGNDSGWGDYVMEYVKNYGYEPDAIFQGTEVERDTWFTNWEVDIINISRLSLPISATLIRSAIIEKNEDFVRQWCPPVVAEYIIRSIYWGNGFSWLQEIEHNELGEPQ